MCCDLKRGRNISGQHTLPHSQSGPIINAQVLTGGSRSCNTAAISGLWNGGGTLRGEGKRSIRVKRAIGGGGGDGGGVGGWVRSTVP